MRKPLVIFDLDGTLLDTQASIAEAFNRSLAELGAPPREVEEFRFIIGDGARVAASRCLPENRQSDQEIDRCLEGFKRHYDETWRDAMPYDGVNAMLASLRGQVHMAVLSNKDDPFTQQCIADSFGDTFDVVLGHRPEFGLKPDPAGAFHIMQTLSASPDDSMMVGDMAIDMKTSVACNITGVGVLWGFRDAPELISAGAKHIISAPSDLLNLVTTP
ncbi:MAG: HAD family hydrolase [Pseudomonadales bacterium]|jgi:phosphoglycolate phosphatase|nr:HAD family hydrolase [Pseudomonadales bacterium]